MSNTLPPGANAAVMMAKDKEDEGLDRTALDVLIKTRTIHLFGAVDGRLARKVITALTYLEGDDPEAPITVLQNSPGGSVSDGFAIYDTMRFIRPPVRIVCLGLTASIATITLLGADKQDRVSLPNTRFLIHQPLIPGNVFGPASDLEITAREILRTRDKINEMLAEATGQPLERITRDTQRDYWMDAAAALDYGLISRIVTSREDL
jgi:ATP-dependent Clp protease protease subunit